MTANALLSAVLADPFDDGPRFVYADWLEENEERERADFIQTQITKGLQCDNCMGDSAVGQPCPYNGGKLCPYCDDLQEETGLPSSLFGEGKVIYRRGFVDEVRCTMREWCGPIPCNMCGRWNLELIELYGRSHVIRPNKNCFHCNGTGRTPGIAKSVCEAWPVTRVVLTDRKPHYRHISGGYQAPSWLSDSNQMYATGTSYQLAVLPESLYAIVKELYESHICGDDYECFEEEKVAYETLSHAALTYGRRLAGLPELENK